MTEEQTSIVERIREGLYFRRFKTLRNLLDILEDTLALYLGISNATLHRRKKHASFHNQKASVWCASPACLELLTLYLVMRQPLVSGSRQKTPAPPANLH